MGLTCSHTNSKISVIRHLVLMALHPTPASAALNFSSSEAGKVQWSLDCDWVGNDIGRAAGKGETCGQQCLSRADCTHWTWSAFNGGTCWLKGAINATELVPATGTSCGYRVGDSATGNPYATVKQYLNPGYKTSVKSAMRATLPSDAPFFASVADHPTAVWLDRMAALDSIQGHLDDAKAQAAGKPILVQFVIYDLPGRDCKAWSSNGEIPKGGLDTHKTKHIDVAVLAFQKKAANVRLSLVIEPDSLPNIATNMGMNRCDATTDKEYTEGVAYAIAELSQIPDTTLYLDSSFGGWLGWPEGMKRVVAVYKKVLTRARQIRANAKIRGFASNVANYIPLFASGCPALEKCPLAKNPSTGEMCYDWNPCIDENRFTSRMNAYLGALGLPTRWIVDTSRSGRAGIRKRWGSWCNVKGAGIGQRLEANPANAPQGGLGWSHAAPSPFPHTFCLPARWLMLWFGSSRLGRAMAIRKYLIPPMRLRTKFLGIFPVDRECNPDDALGLDALPSATRAGQWFQTQFTALVRYANPPMPAGKVDPPTPADPCKTDLKTNHACDPFWEDLAVKYSPQYKFHPDETIWPITIDEYLTHVYDSMGSYFVGNTECKVEYQAGPITPDNLNTLLENVDLKSEHGHTVLRILGEIDQNTDWVKDSRRNPKNGGTKLYTVIYNPKPDDTDSFVEIQYWLFYPYNYVNLLAGEYNRITDLVAIAIRFTKSGQPQRVWYAQHGGGPVWAWDTGADWADSKPKEFATVMGTHPIVYVAEGTHEHYHKVGSSFHCNVGNCDETANGGVAWAPFDNPQSAFEFVHVKSEMSASMPNANRAKLFKGRNKWMGFKGKIGGYCKCIRPKHSVYRTLWMIGADFVCFVLRLELALQG
ncbi:unnamed protein product [Closterium sp. Yama58-4]|nr:unnamed protein product [Closterium sp. Yama58-4]